MDSKRLSEEFRSAVMNNKIDNLLQILDSNDFNLDTPFSSGWTALMYAANYAFTECLQCLLKHGANPNMHKDGYTVLMAACSSTTTNEDHILQCVIHLTEAGADINCYDRYYMTPIMYAAREGRTKVVEHLIQSRAILDIQTPKGYTALMWATQRGHVSVVRVLVDANADVNKQKPDGKKAVDIAVQNDHKEIAKLLGGEIEPPPIQSISSIPNLTSGQQAASPVLKPTSTSSSNLTLSLNSQAIKKPWNSSWTDDLVSAKISVETCNELDLFLWGLDLNSLIPVFKKHELTFQSLLSMTVKDLHEIGVNHPDVCRKLLDAIRETHKSKLLTSPAGDYSSKISCQESVAMLANVKKHIAYVTSCLGYVSDQIRSDKRIILEAVDADHVHELRSNTEKAISNTKELYDELVLLRQRVQQVCPKHNFVPEKLVSPSKRRGPDFKRILFATVATMASVGCLLTVSSFVLKPPPGV